MDAAPRLLFADVSRETRSRLDSYAELLRKWSPRINLVSPKTLEDIKARHFDDSLQLLRFLPSGTRRLVDLGSGAGFPGLPIAIAACDLFPKLEVHLVESDQRKAAFLRTVSRETKTPVKIHTGRAEVIAPLQGDTVSARALAPLAALLPMVQRHLKRDGFALLPKGRNYAQELADARRRWQFTCKILPSQTDPGAVILRIGDICDA